MSSSAEVRARILAAARAPSSMTRGAARRRGALWVALAVATSVGVLWMLGGVRQAPRPRELVVLTTLGLALIAALVALTTLRRGRSMSGPPPWALVLTTLCGMTAMLVWKHGVSSLYDGMVAAWPERPGFRCLRLTLALGVVPLLATLLARRWTVASHPGLAGAAMGATIGLAAMVGVDLWCPVAYLPHLLLGHLLPLMVLAAAGAAVGRRLLSPTGGSITPPR